MERRFPSFCFGTKLVALVGTVFSIDGCGASTGKGGPADAAEAHVDGASGQGAVGGGDTDDGGAGSADDVALSLEASTADEGPPVQCPAPTEEAGAIMAVAPVCSPIPPISPIIAAFETTPASAFAPWGTEHLVGGPFVYPGCPSTTPLFADYSMNNWHITGTVGTYSGFGIWWEVYSGMSSGFPTYDLYAPGVIDATAYAGIQFDISGDPGPLGAIVFFLESANQQTPSADSSNPNCGVCDPDAGACNVAATYGVASIGVTPKTVRVRWSDLATTPGQPFDPGNLVNIAWQFPWVPGAMYRVDVTLDNIEFIPASSGDGG